MADRVLLSAFDRNIEACVQLAEEQDLGIEVMAFAFPDVLDGDWKSLVVKYRKLLRRVPGMMTMHGPFMDMAPGSPDQRINQICVERYQQAIRIAAELGIEVIVFHANFIAAIHTLEYRLGWHNRNVYFWAPMADFARRNGLTIAVENMWEYDPYIIADVVREIAHPNLGICLDVGHAHLFGEVPFEEWLKVVEPLIIHSHMNNNNGKVDVHLGFHQGVLDYTQIMEQIRGLSTPPSITLEMDDVEAMRESLRYMDLGNPAERLQRRPLLSSMIPPEG